MVRQLPASRSSEAAAAFWADHDVGSAPPATSHTDRVYQALHAVSGTEGSLYLRLAYVRRKDLSCCRLAIHIEPRSVQGRLNGHPLAALKVLLLRLTSRRKHTKSIYLFFIIIAPMLFSVLNVEQEVCQIE